MNISFEIIASDIRIKESSDKFPYIDASYLIFNFFVGTNRDIISKITNKFDEVKFKLEMKRELNTS